jgi:hypothetical protein
VVSLKLTDLYSSTNIIWVIKTRRMKCDGHIACMGREKVGKPEEMRPLGRPRCRWEDNIKMDLQEAGYWGMDWIDLAQDRDGWWAIVNAVMKLRVPQNVGNFLNS